MAKIILDKPVYVSATEALNELEWETMFKRRKLNRLHFMYIVVNNVFDWDFHIPQQQEVHGYHTRRKSDQKIPTSRTKWGKYRLAHRGVMEWNSVPENVRNIKNDKAFLKALNYLFNTEYFYLFNFF